MVDSIVNKATPVVSKVKDRAKKYYTGVDALIDVMADTGPIDLGIPLYDSVEIAKGDEIEDGYNWIFEDKPRNKEHIFKRRVKE